MKDIVKKLLFFIFSLCVECNSIEYIDGQVVTLYKVLTGSHVVKVSIDQFEHGSVFNNEVNNKKRDYGIHNMQVIVKGYEPIDLIKDDVCYYPRLFTLIAHMVSAENPVVQRWACVKYFHPLSFFFKVESGSLRVFSAVYRWKLLAPCLTEEIIPLKRIGEVFLNQGVLTSAIVNGKKVELTDEIMVIQ